MTLAVVTGSTGHVGANLVRALLAQGRKVRAVVFGDGRALADLDVEREAADVTQLKKCEPLYTTESLRTIGANRNVSSLKASNELGHTSRPLAETIADCYAWFGSRGMLAGRAT